MSLEQYHKLILRLLAATLSTGGFCVAYGLLSPEPSARVMLTGVVIVPALSGLLSMLNGLCALQHSAIFIWRGRNLEVFKSHATGLAQFKVLTGIFWAVGIFLLFIAGKIATIIAS
jgi:hypothetical protein